MKAHLRTLLGSLLILVPALVLGAPQLATAGKGWNNDAKQYRVKIKIKHDVDDAPNYTEWYWTDLWFYEDGDFFDGDFWGEWDYDGEEVQADVSWDYEDWLWWDWNADDVDAEYRYTDIFFDGDKIRGNIKGFADVEVEFFFFDDDYEETFKGKLKGYEVDEWDDWGWWPW